ncbi:hypothetical protein OAA58_00490 [Polaribacter sp.]|nr:hypothetical protein [Polaribacter sp.]
MARNSQWIDTVCSLLTRAEIRTTKLSDGAISSNTITYLMIKTECFGWV